MLNKRTLFLVPPVLLGLSANAFSWGSIGILGPSTHTRIAAKALKLVDTRVYPDMDTAAQLIKQGSTSEAGHEGIHNGGGRLKDWWTGGDGRSTLKGGVLPNYTQLRITDAYLNIGRMCHLTQDQAVPAHASRVPHSIVLHLPPDGVEKYTGKNHDFGAIPQVDNSRQPYEYYQELQNETRGHLGEWVNPRTQVPFWVQSEEGARLTDATLGAPGSYGGGADTFLDAAASNERIPGGLTASEIAARQLGMAAGYTKALVESASRELPPLVYGVSLYPNVATPGHKVEIAFTALENRTPHVRYEIGLRPAGGQRRALMSGELQLEEPRPAFNTGGDNQPAQPSPEENLFNRRVSLKWDGILDGKPLAEGTYTIDVQLMDDDGNMVPASVNTDGVTENNTSRDLVVVNTEPSSDLSLSFN